MKITKSQLRQIIREELTSEGNEEHHAPSRSPAGRYPPDVTHYAILDIPGQGVAIQWGKTLEDLREQLKDGQLLPGVEVRAIFTANVIEGSIL